MVEWPCCYDPLRLSLGSYDLFFTNISPPLSLWARSLWVTEVDEPHNRPLLCWGTEVQCGKVYWATEVQHEKYAGSRKCSTKNMLGHGSAARKNMLGHGRPPRLASAPLLSRQVPAGLFGVLCSSVPQSDFHSHPPLAEDAPSFGPRQATCVIAT